MREPPEGHGRHTPPWRRWLANGVFVVGLLLVLVPLAMQMYGSWWEGRQRAFFLADAATIAAEPPSSTAESATGSNQNPAGLPANRTSPSRNPSPTPVKLAARTSGKDRAQAKPATRKTIRKATKAAAGAVPGAHRARLKSDASLLQIPSIGVDAVVTRASGSWKWIKGPAYDPRSARPGSRGNTVIAAHRNMWARTFAQLPRVRPGDRVMIQTPQRRYTYVVQWSRKVRTSDRRAIGRTKEPCVTLYTCMLPFRENQRWVVRARLVESRAATPTSTRIAQTR